METLVTVNMGRAFYLMKEVDAVQSNAIAGWVLPPSVA